LKLILYIFLDDWQLFFHGRCIGLRFIQRADENHLF